MRKIRTFSEAEVPEEVRSGYQRDKAVHGRVLDGTLLYAHAPAIIGAARALGAAVSRSARVPAQLRLLLNVKAASMVGCPF